MSLQKFLKGKSDAVRVAHLHSAAGALSSPSPSRWIQLSRTNLDKDLFGCFLCSDARAIFTSVKRLLMSCVFSHSETLHCENKID